MGFQSTIFGTPLLLVSLFERTSKFGADIEEGQGGKPAFDYPSHPVLIEEVAVAASIEAAIDVG